MKSRFKVNEIVLIPNGSGAYVQRRIYSIEPCGRILINQLSYATDYAKEDVHKCPPSIKREIGR